MVFINKYYSSEFPNWVKLAQIAPVHTADCERGFSAQNIVKTAHRKRLSPSTVVICIREKRSHVVLKVS